jgi:long-chain acyl-CoA synthetase
VHRPWLSSYPPGVPSEVATGAYDSLSDLLDEAFRKHADRDAACFMERRYTFSQMDEMSMSLAAWFQSLELQPGARIALMMPNIPQYMVAIAAVLRAGYVVVNVNPLYTPRELEHQLHDSGAQVIVVLENFATTLEAVLMRTDVRHVVLTSVGDLLGVCRGSLVNFAVRHVRKMVPAFELPAEDGYQVLRFNRALAMGSRLQWRRPATGRGPAFLQYTGGTTGGSKGATLLHRNVIANILQCEAWFGPMLKSLGDCQQTIVCALPLYHIFALTSCFMLGARLGMTNLLIASPRDTSSLVATLRRHRVNMFPAVNTLFNALLHEPDFAKVDFSGLRVSNGGGMAVQAATAEQWLQRTGCPIVEGYGLSETSPAVTCNRLDIRDFTGSIGLPLPSTEVSIRDDGGNEVPHGEPGEICIRGPQVMEGYWNQPDETAKVMSGDGFFRSGDIGLMDSRGYFRIVDRKKDMILVSGFNVYPTEIEQVVSRHPGVLECAAVGVPDDKSGEAVILFVVRRYHNLSEAELVQYCRENFTPYKRPRAIEFRNELPKSNVGKILRRELRIMHH